MKTPEELLKIIQSHMAQLGEYFDSVQIFCTNKDEESTLSMFDGCGNWYARFGQVKAWIIAEEKILSMERRIEEEEK